MTVTSNSVALSALILICGATTSAKADTDIYCRKDGAEGHTVDECRLLYSTSAEKNSVTGQKRALVKSAPEIKNPPPSAKANPPEQSTWAQDHIFLRQSLKDLGTFSNPSALDKATGAQVSWTDDHVQKNRTWATQGLIGVKSEDWGQGPANIQHQLVGTYFGWNSLENSGVKLKSKNIDDATFGFIHEVAFGKLEGQLSGADHYFRTMGELITNFDGQTKSWKAALQYQPIGNGGCPPVGFSCPPETVFTHLGSVEPVGPYVLVVSPTIDVEYRGSLDGSKDPLFAFHRTVLRGGPSISIDLVPYTISDVPSNGLDFWGRTKFGFSYGYLHDLQRGRDYKILGASASYALDKDKNYALTLTYDRGELETTGQKEDVIKLALSAKFGGPAKSNPKGAVGAVGAGQ
jgi:hypothetical protein